MCVHNHTLHLPVFMFYLNALNAFMDNWVLQYLLFTSVCEKYLQNVRKCVYLQGEYAGDHAIACTCSSGHALLVKNPTFLSM